MRISRPLSLIARVRRDHRDDDVDPAIPILEQRLIEIDSATQFLINNDFPRERDGSLSRFPLSGNLLKKLSASVRSAREKRRA